jgi:hypothetical protein
MYRSVVEIESSAEGTEAGFGVDTTADPQAVVNKLRIKNNDKRCFIVLLFRIKDFGFDIAHPILDKFHLT